jgi:hypothetical protein
MPVPAFPQPEPNDVTRRRLFGLGGRAAAAGVIGGALWPSLSQAADAGANPWPTDALPASAADTLVSSQFTSAEQLAAWGAEVDALGLRPPGFANHTGYVSTLAERFQQAGLQNVTLDSVPLKRWGAKSWSAVVDGKPLEHTYYAPYSKGTGPEGVTAPLIYAPVGEILTGTLRNPTDVLNSLTFNRKLRGKIVVFKVPYTALPLLAFRALSYPGGWNMAGDSRSQYGFYKRPWLNSIVSLLKYFQKAGAVGTIGIWPDLPGEWAKQYTPYDAEFRDIPSLWIDRDEGAKLKARANKGVSATITLETEVVDTTTENLIGFIPGASDELTVLHSHTDGTNGMEENGQLGILAATQYLARLPKGSLPRTVMVMLSAGHFGGGVGIKHFLDHHADDLVPRITSILTLEHLGCLEWLPRDGEIKPTGFHEFGASFAPNSKAMTTALIKAQNANGIASGTIRPFQSAPAGPRTIKKKVGWPGEGTYWWWYGALNTGNYITGPYGLITADLNTTGMVDYEQMRRESMTAVQTVLQLAAASKANLKAR